MTESEVRNYSRFLFEQLQSKDKQMQSILDSLDEIKEELKFANKLLNQSTCETDQLRKENERLVNLLAVLNQEHFGSKSQKGIV